ncbi:helix-turn-helix domain-containing protein [Janibacter limosus]|uniref:helix-turn-helix domain-containing protein n=1 Tax=Janibacter limosus TaxID=53458 RepID=UPI0008326023|nr:helix-turn-helix transcriptional regulator [Janibacter limosus]
MRQSPGGTWLHRLRRESGRTQGELSRLSGVSVRTIRGLERGEILTPQIATLQQLVLALQLGPQAQAEFMHAWATPPQAGFDELLVDPNLSEVEQIDALTRSALGSYRVISQVWRTRVSAGRRLVHTACHSAVVAVEDRLDRVFNVQSGDAGTRAEDLEFVPLLGCRLGNRWDFAESNVAVFEVVLPRQLAKGEPHAYAYEILDRGEPGRGLADSDGFVWGPPHTARSVIVSVEFEVAPARVTRLERAPGQDFVPLGDVELDDANRASLVMEDAGPGAFGFTWTW